MDEQDPPPPPPPPPEPPVTAPEEIPEPVDHQRPGDDGARNQPEPANMSSPASDPETSHRSSPNTAAQPGPASPAPKKIKAKPRPVLSDSEKKKICQQNEGKYISFYSDVYFVKGCKRQPLLSTDIYEHTRLGRQIDEVKRIVIEALEEGSAFQANALAGQFRTCKDLEGKYITFKFGDIYLVRNCERKVFLDWASFEAHRGDISAPRAVINSVTWTEFSALKEGRPMPSVIMEEYKEILNGQKQVDVIPIDEACDGINGRYVSYYSRIYKVEKCHKREINAIAFSKQLGANPIRLVEMSSEQWISLPDGPPLGKM